MLFYNCRANWILQTIHSTAALNPSFLSKGTYGTITIAPPSAGTPTSRLTVEVAKLDALKPSDGTTPLTRNSYLSNDSRNTLE